MRDASNTELVFRIIHTVNQLSIYGAVSNWCEHFEKGQERILESVNKEILKSVNSQEVNSLVSSPRPASGNRLRENIQDFGSLPVIIQFKEVCELASFWYRVSAALSCKTKPDEDDGFGESELGLAKSKTSTREIGAASDPSSRKLDADVVSLSPSPAYYTKRTILTKERKWKIIPAYSSYNGGSLSTAISKMVTRLVRHYDQEERQCVAAVHWDAIESVRGQRSTRFLRNRLASTHP